MQSPRLFIFLLFTVLILAQSTFAQQTGGISGQITDSLGGAVPGVLITITDADGKERKTLSNKEGEFAFKDVKTGKYTIRATAPKFSPFEKPEIVVEANQKLNIPINLTIAPIENEVEVGNDNHQVSTESDANASSMVLSGQDIEDLPDDPEELEAYLQAMAGGAVGLDGGQFYVDGITSGRIPPKSSIREIRVNRSPFSAEYERAGFGGIEIITKPGTDKFRGSSNFNFNDARLNSRNPFALMRPPSQARNLGGSFSGPLKSKVASFFVDYNNNQQDNSRVVNASVIDSSFNVVPLREEINVPSRSSSIGARVDYQLNEKNTLMFRYGFSRNNSENQGVSDFSLPTRAFQVSGSSQDFRLTEAMIVNPKTVNETLFAFSLNKREQEGDNSTPTINVSGAFTGGGSQVGLNYNDSTRWEIQNNTTTSFGKDSQHSIKFGVRVRGISIKDRSESNFGGMFTFAGVRDSQTGALLYSSIEQYRQKVLGNPDPRFNPNQFSINSGEALSDIAQTDLGLFITDEWRVRSTFTLSFGLRYEDQTNIKDFNDFAPRFGFAYALDSHKGKPAKTVLRGGFGVFYNRLSENFFLQAKRFGGTQQTQYIVPANSAILGQPTFTLNSVKNVPTVAELSAFASQNSVTVRRVAADLDSPLAYQIAFSVDRQLPFKTKAAATYIYNRGFSQLGTRNINAPVCPPLTVCPADSPRPNPGEGNIYLYESIGELRQQQLIVNINSNAFKGFSLGGNYRLGMIENNFDGGSFPSYSYDLNLDYGAASQDIRHSFSLYSSFQMPFKIRVSPSVSISSGRPFNITSGADSNRDSIFNDRPTFAQLSATCKKLGLTNDFCDISGVNNPEKTIVPRNYGRGPGFFNLNLNLNRTFTFRKNEKARAYNLVFGVQANNLLNHTNRNAPISNLSSNRFGQVFSTMNSFGGTANRRIDLQVRFNF